MIITLESTTEIVTLDGVACRVWLGATEHGVPLTAFVARLAVPRDSDAGQLEAELLETRTPSAPAEPWRPCCGKCGAEQIDPLHVPIVCMACDEPWDGSEVQPGQRWPARMKL